MRIKLGLCNIPEPIYLFVGNGNSGGKSHCWYYHDPNTEINTPEYSTALCGYLRELRLTSKEFKGEENMKLDIVMSADETYIIRTGIETNFAKTFLVAIALVEDLSQPIIIGCSAGEQNTVFCRVYDGITKFKIKAIWNPQADWASIISDVQARLTGKETTSKGNLTGQDLRIRKIRTLLNYPASLIMEWLKIRNVSKPSELEPGKVDDLVQAICLDWAKDKFSHSNHAANSYTKYVLNRIANGVDEILAIRDWVNNVTEESKKVPYGEGK